MHEGEAWVIIRDALNEALGHLPDFMEEEENEKVNKAVDLLNQYFGT